jgi:hypothetical protein
MTDCADWQLLWGSQFARTSGQKNILNRHISSCKITLFSFCITRVDDWYPYVNLGNQQGLQINVKIVVPYRHHRIPAQTNYAGSTCVIKQYISIHILCSWTISIVSSLSKILTKHFVNMSRNIICVLIYHRHKPLDQINLNVNIRRPTTPRILCILLLNIISQDFRVRGEI